MHCIHWVCWWFCSTSVTAPACRGLGLKLCLLSADTVIPQHPCFSQLKALNSWTFKTYANFNNNSFFIPLLISQLYTTYLRSITTTIVIICKVFSGHALSKPAFLETCIFMELVAWMWSASSYLRLITFKSDLSANAEEPFTTKLVKGPA